MQKKSKTWKRLIAEEMFAFGKTAAKMPADFVNSNLPRDRRLDSLRSDLMRLAERGIGGQR